MVLLAMRCTVAQMGGTLPGMRRMEHYGGGAYGDSARGL